MAANLPSGSKAYKKPIKKNVGLRAFFPEMPSNMSNLEKAKIWVKRHNNNYFMGWTQEQLQNLDPIVRPLTIITPELYKRHMNRSEYCRIVKLKYCLESDADWAKEFRQRLGTDSSKGGFRSLGEAKLFATQLWREYSELYDVHRARIGNSNSRASLEKSHPIDSSTRRTPKPIRLTCSTESVPTTTTMSSSSTTTGLLLTSSGLPEQHPLVSPYRRDDEKILTLHLPSLDDAHHTQTSEFPTSSSYNQIPIIKVEREDSKYELSSAVNSAEGLSSWSVENNKVSSTHDMPVFPSVDQMELSILERVDVLLRRKRKDFFLDYTEAQLKNLSPYERPLTLVRAKEYQEYLFSDEGQLTSALATVFDLTEPWAFRFKKMLHLSPEEGGFGTWSAVKEELHILLQNHLLASNLYQDSTPAVDASNLPSTSGLVEKGVEGFEYSGPGSNLSAARDPLKEGPGAVYYSTGPGLLSIGRIEQKKSPDSSERTVTSQISPLAPDMAEDAITIDDDEDIDDEDTNSGDHFSRVVHHAPLDPSPSNSLKRGDPELWVAGTVDPGAADHRLERVNPNPNPFQKQLPDPNLNPAPSSSSLDRGPLDRNSLVTLSSTYSTSSSAPIISVPSKYSSPLSKVGGLMSFYGRNQIGLENPECSPLNETRKIPRIMPRFTPQPALPMETSPVNNNNNNNIGDSPKLSAPGVLPIPNATTTKSLLVNKLWSLRDRLAERCREDPAVSWHDKLRPHLKLIRSQLGETYTLPNTIQECMADLFLVTLQQELLDRSPSVIDSNS